MYAIQKQKRTRKKRPSLHSHELPTVNLVVPLLPGYFLCGHTLRPLIALEVRLHGALTSQGQDAFRVAFRFCPEALSLQAIVSPFCRVLSDRPRAAAAPRGAGSGTPEGDVYSFAIPMRELIHQQD